VYPLEAGGRGALGTPGVHSVCGLWPAGRSWCFFPTHPTSRGTPHWAPSVCSCRWVAEASFDAGAHKPPV